VAEPLDKSAIIARIRVLRESYVGKRGKALFSNKLGISPSTYNYYERDRLAPAPILYRICQITGADIHWLLTGQNPGSHEKPLLPPALLSKIDATLKHRPDTLAAIDAFLDLLNQRPQATNQPHQPPKRTDEPHRGGTNWVPVLGRTAAGVIHFWRQSEHEPPDVTEMGELIREHQNRRQQHAQATDIACEAALADVPPLPPNDAALVQLSELPADGITEFVACDPVAERFPDAFALRVDGESMAPRIRDGDIILLSPSVPAREAAAAVVQLRDQIGVTCKIIRHAQGQVHLIAANEEFPTKVVADQEVLWALAVLYRIRL